SLLPGSKVPTITAVTPMRQGVNTQTPAKGANELPLSKSDSQRPSAQKAYENNLVRVDNKARKITSMLPPGQRPSGPTEAQNEEPAPDDMEYEYSEKEHTICRLTAVKELRAEVREEMHNELTDNFAKHIFVGVVDERRRIAAIQAGVKLFLVDYGMICNEYFYQLGLTDFGNFGSIRFNPPLSLRELLALAAAHEKQTAGDIDGFDWDEVVATIEEQLTGRRDMLAEYFALEISPEGELLSIPLMVKGYTPSLAKLPNFLLRLGPHVDWNDEKGCFQSFLRELACFYVPEALPPPQVSNASGVEEEELEDPGITMRRKQLHRAIENVLFPAFKARLIATKGLLKGVVEVADLKGLYRVFERC
ncbi:hypothetical protein LTR28_000922, partial [Elasticomyces elasticus]